MVCTFLQLQTNGDTVSDVMLYQQVAQLLPILMSQFTHTSWVSTILQMLDLPAVCWLLK